MFGGVRHRRRAAARLLQAAPTCLTPLVALEGLWTLRSRQSHGCGLCGGRSSPGGAAAAFQLQSRGPAVAEAGSRRLPPSAVLVIPLKHGGAEVPGWSPTRSAGGPGLRFSVSFQERKHICSCPGQAFPEQLQAMRAGKKRTEQPGSAARTLDRQQLGPRPSAGSAAVHRAVLRATRRRLPGSRLRRIVFE